MSNFKFAGQQWEFVDADSVIRSLNDAPISAAEFPTRWRTFGPLPPETIKTCGYIYSAPVGNGVVPLVSADSGGPERLGLAEARRVSPHRLVRGLC